MQMLRAIYQSKTKKSVKPIAIDHLGNAIHFTADIVRLSIFQRTSTRSMHLCFVLFLFVDMKNYEYNLKYFHYLFNEVLSLIVCIPDIWILVKR